VASQLAATGASVERIGGLDRFETSALVSGFAEPGGTVYLATGVDFPDALAAGSPAGLQQAPVLLVQPDGIPAVIQAQLLALQPTRVVILGGTGAISDNVRAQAAALFPN